MGENLIFQKPKTIEGVTVPSRDGDRLLIRIEASQEVSAGDIIATEHFFYMVKSVRVVAEGENWTKLIIEVGDRWPSREENV